MSGFTLSLRRESLKSGPTEFTLPALWDSETRLTRDYYRGPDGIPYEVWRVVTTAAAYDSALGRTPGDALRAFASELDRSFGETGVRSNLQWTASVEAAAYDTATGRTLGAAFRDLADEFDEVFGEEPRGNWNRDGAVDAVDLPAPEEL